MTANEIIKAFECCLNDGTCENCPYKSKGVVCGSHMRNDVLALLKEQAAELEKARAKTCEGETASAAAFDAVNRPAHYTEGGVECIDVMIQTQGKEAVKAFCICNAFKYLFRHGKKNGLEDIKKAAWYLNKYIELEGQK